MSFRKILIWAPPVLWAAFIFSLSHRTSAELPDVSWAPPGTDKLVHAALYCVLGGLLALAFAVASPMRGRGRIILAAFALGLAYGGFDELHQAFVPTRSPDLLDLAADALGLALGAWLAFDFIVEPRLTNDK